jgi:hypothetical protein
MKDDRDVALGWLQKTDSDLANAELCLAAGKSLDTACFHRWISEAEAEEYRGLRGYGKLAKALAN